MKNEEEKKDAVLYDRTGRKTKVTRQADDGIQRCYEVEREGVDHVETLKIYPEHLVDLLHQSLYPLSNLKDILNNEDEPPAIYFLLDHLIEEAEEQISYICDTINGQIGTIKLDCAKSCWPLEKGQIIAAYIVPKKAEAAT
ncbi:MAG TPA: hypothetical protein PKJ10_05385 [Smithella sp.]|nr:hypothetical protein [Smithella sp.]